jgi:hypothetical protein
LGWGNLRARFEFYSDFLKPDDKMAKAKKRRIITPSKLKVNPSESDKTMIGVAFNDIVDKFKKECIPKEPNRKYNYLIDIYSIWYRNFFYLCEYFKSEHPDRIADEFEKRFVRLEYRGKDSFNFSYFRHIGVWHLVAKSISLEDCKELILSNPNFQPLPN